MSNDQRNAEFSMPAGPHTEDEYRERVAASRRGGLFMLALILVAATVAGIWL